MKPILDAVTGPNSILVDDNQIQSIKASWITPGAVGAGFDLVFEALLCEEYMARAGLTFVEFSADRCYVLPRLSAGHEAAFVHAYRSAVEAYQEMLAAGIHRDAARAVLPVARPFPRARLSNFTVRHESDFQRPGP